MRGELRCGTGRGGVVQRSVVWCGVSGAARGKGHRGHVPPPHRMSGGPKGRYFNVFFCKLKTRFIIFL